MSKKEKIKITDANVTYENIDADYIEEYCVKNGEIDWLVETTSKTYTHTVYPKVPKINKDGKEVLVYDKKQEPIGKEERAIPFTKIKRLFCEKFMPALIPETKDKPMSMKERALALQKKYK